MALSGVPLALAVVLACLGGLLALAGLVILLLKLGVIAHLWTRPEPVDESPGHTLDQSREPGKPSAASHRKA